jgi:hypothetical protein
LILFPYPYSPFSLLLLKDKEKNKCNNKNIKGELKLKEEKNKKSQGHLKEFFYLSSSFTSSFSTTVCLVRRQNHTERYRGTDKEVTKKTHKQHSQIHPHTHIHPYTYTTHYTLTHSIEGLSRVRPELEPGFSTR